MRKLLATYGPLNPDGCWIWPGATAAGYGTVMTGSRSDGSRRARGCHVVMWEALHGPTPAGKELAHRCMTPLCCNPAHVRPLTHAENNSEVPEQIKQERRDRLALGREAYQAEQRARKAMRALVYYLKVLWEELTWPAR